MSSPTVTAIIACYAIERLPLTLRCVTSVLTQSYPLACIVVVDGNDELAARLRIHLPKNVDIRTLDSQQGASGARNSVALTVDTDTIAFIDDDAYAETDWMTHLLAPMADPGVVGVGGRIVPRWSRRPEWFPDVFGWVVGASIERGDQPVPVRNVWSGNMAVRTSEFQASGGFREGWGKIGDFSEPEDTELCIRLATDGRTWVFQPNAVVHHEVPPERTTLKYFMERCWAEGRGKARLRRVHPESNAALTSEVTYLTGQMPRALGVHLVRAAHGSSPDLRRALACVLGLSSTISAFAWATIRPQRPTNRTTATT